MSEAELRALGLSDLQIESIIDAGRPSIPEQVLSSILFRCKWVCCICRDPNRSAIIHHLSPWALSRSHAEDNLVVLCHQHHDEAHTTRKLSLNLTPERIKDARDRWYAEAEAFNHKEAERLANLIAGDHRLFSTHRGIKSWGSDATILYGNDGPSDARTILEIENVRKSLQAHGIDEIGFGASTHDQTWVLLAATNDMNALDGILWHAFWDAYEALRQRPESAPQA